MVYLLEGALLVEEEKFLKKKELRVMRTFLMEPEEGWEGYLNDNFSRSDDWKTIEGKLNLWEEVRIPTPFVYFFSKGRLLDVFIFKDEKFSSAPMGEFEGSRMSYGIIVPILSVEKTYTKIITYEILSEPNDDK